MNPSVSDEVLNAFVDGELDLVESEALLARIREDRDLAQRVCALRSLQSMVRLAYLEPPVVGGQRSGAGSRRRMIQRAAVGGLILLAGVMGGWSLRGFDSPPVAALPAAASASYQVVSLNGVADPDRVMLHIDSAAPEKMKAVLDQAEHLLDEADRQGRTLQLEVIANSFGIDLLRAGYSPHAERMARMKQRHANLQWVACGQSIARLRSNGELIELLPNTETASTAISEIVTRLQQGWTYVRV